MLPLFKAYPGLAKAVPHVIVGQFPTPVRALGGLENELGRSGLFIKCDDLSGLDYGGNKVRKLEFLLADALAQGAVRVITTGAAGSNHALATALYAGKLGLRATLILGEQPVSHIVRDNLLMDSFIGAEMIYEEEYARMNATIERVAGEYFRAEGRAPYIIPAGGSSETGAIGFVNAAFELAEQIGQGALPEPGAIAVAMGTMGTAAGLLLGLKAAGVKSRLIAVRVIPTTIANQEKFADFFRRLNERVRQIDPSFPAVALSAGDITFCDDYFDPGYGLASKTVASAISLVERTDAIHLDPTYTGKAFAAFVSEARKREPGGPPLLFWNTKNSRELPGEALGKDYRTALPKEFHSYFGP